MEISEFQGKLRELLSEVYAATEPMSDEVFWERAVTLFASVANPRIKAREREDQLTTVKTDTHEGVARRDRENAVTGWQLQRWNTSQIGAINTFVNTGEVQAELPQQYKSAAAERGYRSARELKQIERERRLAVVMGWSGYIWNSAQTAAIRDYVNDGVVSGALPRQYREKDSASRGR